MQKILGQKTVSECNSKYTIELTDSYNEQSTTSNNSIDTKSTSPNGTKTFVENETFFSDKKKKINYTIEGVVVTNC